MLRKSKWIFAISFLLFFTTPSLALYHIEIYGEISQKNTVILNYTLIELNNEKGREITIIFEDELEILSIPENCKIISYGVSCTLDEGKRIKIDISTEKKVKKEEDKYVFEENFRVLENVKSVTILIKLPEGAVLPEKGIKFLPENATIGTDGRRILLLWSRENLNSGEVYGVKVFYEIISENEGFPLIFILIPVLGILILILFVFLKRRGDEKMALSLLKEDEKIVMEIILKYPKGVNQKKIVLESGYSKAKISKVLKSLADRGIIKLERIGRTNKVYLRKDFFKRSGDESS